MFDIRAVGAFDLIEADEEGSLVIADLKTASRRYSDIQLETDLQGSVYSYALKQLGFSMDEQRTLIRLDVLLKTKKFGLERSFLSGVPLTIGE